MGNMYASRIGICVAVVRYLRERKIRQGTILIRNKFTLLACMLLTFGCAPLFANTPTFNLVEIRVEGVRDNAEGIILAESRLSKKATYSEAELFAAMVRLNRLPFVLDAEFRLEKGGEFQTYVLVIEVQPTKRFFFQQGVTYNHRNFNNSDKSIGYAEDTLTLGMRLFPSLNTQFYAAVDPGIQIADSDNEAPLTITSGFSYYDLGGPGRFFNAEVFYSDGKSRLSNRFDGDASFAEAENVGLDLLYAVPVLRNHWIRFGAGLRLRESTVRERRSGFLIGRTIDQQDNERDLKYVWMDWERNTINDHTLPTRGHRLRVGVAYLQDRVDFWFPEEPSVRFIDNQDERAAFFVYEQHWQPWSRQTISLGTITRVGREKFETHNTFLSDPEPGDLPRKGSSTDTRGGIEVGTSFDFLRSAGDGKIRDLRLELIAETSLDKGTFDPVSGENRFVGVDDDTANVSLKLIFRNVWGVVRFAISYGWE